MVDQQMADVGERNVAARASTNNFAPAAVNEKIGDARKGEYVAALGFAATQPRRASGKPGSQIPSNVEAQALKALGQACPHDTPARPCLDRREFGDRNICDDSESVSALTEARGTRLF